MSKKDFKINCRQCESEFFYYQSEFRPFCSERCQMIDLGHWMSESYRAPSATPLSEEEIEMVIKLKAGEVGKD